MMKPFALYVGFSHAPNFGDWWLYEIIKEQLPAFRTIPLSRAVRRYGFRRMLYWAWQKKMLPTPHVMLLGGGTLLIPSTPDTLAPFQATRGRKYAIGTGSFSLAELEQRGFGSEQRDKLRQIYAAFEEITVRGPRSLEAFSSLGLNKPATVVGDPMLSIFKPETQMAGWEGNRVALNVANITGTQRWHWRAKHGPEDLVYDEIIQACRRRGYSLRLFYCSPEDQEICERVSMRHALGPVTSVLSPEAFDQLFQSGSAIIATRLHALIYSVLRGIPVATLIYADKHLDFLNSIGWVDRLPRLSDLPVGNTLEALEAMWEDQRRLWPKITASILELNQRRHRFYERVMAPST